MDQQIEQWITQYVKNYPGLNGSENRWQNPLITFADTQNPLFRQLKEWVQPGHQIPTDLLSDAASVIAYFLPFNPSITHGNIEGRMASKEWGITYIETNRLIADLNAYLAAQLAAEGYLARYTSATHNFDEKTLMSKWSHRHVAYIAGLGRFGLNNMLITEKGCCGRIGTIVTNASVTATSLFPGETCLYRENGSCGKCVNHCVNASLRAESFDRHHCYEMLLENAAALSEIGLADVCGKCTVGLPCSSANPVRSLNAK
jgi:epoxyqueuosine reductase QueG